MHENNMHEHARRLFLYCYSLLALGLLCFSITLCYALEWHGPFRDLWEFVGTIEQQLGGHWDFDQLLQPYGGIHRIFIPKLLFYLDYRFAAGSNMLALSVTLALHSVACALCVYAILGNATLKSKDHILLIASTLLFFFSSTQIYNLIYISDNQVVLGNSLSVLAACIFCHYLRSKQVLFLYLANAVVVLGGLCHSSALMMWPAMILLMFILGQSKKIIVAQTVIACLLIGLYVSGYDPLENPALHLSLWQKLAHSTYALLVNIDGILRYMGLHLSSPTSRDYPLAGLVLSYASIFYLFSIIWRFNTNRWRATPCDIFFLTLACYGVFIAFITACGRQIYPNSALTDRYQTLVMTYWAAMVILLFIDLEKTKPALKYLAPFLSLLLLLPYQYKNAEDMAWLSSRVTLAHTAATVGITDMDTVAATLSHPLLMDKKNLVAAYNDFLRDKRLGYYSDKEAHYFVTKQVLGDIDSASDNKCSGELLTIERINHNVAGEAVSTHDYKFIARGEINQSAVDTLLVIDAQHNVIGLARNHRKRGELLPLAWRKQRSQELHGFIHVTQEPNYPLAFVSNYVSNHADAYCPLFSLANSDSIITIY